MTTVLECLQNARCNLDNIKETGLPLFPLALSQFDNAMAFLVKGYPIDFDMETLFDKYEDLTNLPEYEHS